MAIIIAGIILAGMGFVIGSRISGGNEPQAPESERGASEAANVMVSMRGTEGLQEHVLVALREDEGGYTVITIPVRTVVESQSAGFRRLDILYDEEGRGAVAEAIEGLLGVTLNNYVDVEKEALAEAAGTVETINLATETPVNGSEGQELLAAGDNPRSASAALELLDASLADPVGGSAVQAAFFKGLRDAMASMQEPGRDEQISQLAGSLASDLDEEELAALITTLVDPQQSFGLWPLPVTRSGNGDDWYYEPVISQMEALVQGSNLAQIYRLEVHNGTETQGIVESAAAKLEPLRYNISLDTETSGVNYDHTQVRCGSNALAECDRVVEELGTGTIIKDEYLDSRQIIVIIGMDLAPDGT